MEDMLSADVVVSTAKYFQTRLEELRQITLRNGPIFDLHIYDECHYLPTKSWNSIWEALSGDKPHAPLAAVQQM